MIDRLLLQRTDGPVRGGQEARVFEFQPRHVFEPRDAGGAFRFDPPLLHRFHGFQIQSGVIEIGQRERVGFTAQGRTSFMPFLRHRARLLVACSIARIQVVELVGEDIGKNVIPK